MSSATVCLAQSSAGFAPPRVLSSVPYRAA